MESSLDRRTNQHLLETSIWDKDKEKDKTKNKDCWTKHPLLETSFWDSDQDSDPEEFKALGPEKPTEEIGMKAVFKGLYEEEESVVQSAGQSPSLPGTCSPARSVLVEHQLTPSSTVVQLE